MRTEHGEVFLLRWVDSRGVRTEEVLTLTDYLWRVIGLWCDYECHHLLVDQRGGWRMKVVSGRHDNGRWHIQARSWEELMQKAVQELLPGWWEPAGGKPLRFLTCGPGMPQGLLRLAEMVCKLRPGQTVSVPGRWLQEGMPPFDVRGWTSLDWLFENIGGSSYELLVRDVMGEAGVLEFERLREPLSEEKGLRTYVSPDRRHLFEGPDSRGFWRRVKTGSGEG